jgi:glucans biosynthesis protein C
MVAVRNTKEWEADMKRMVYLDRLKVLLTMLVILHHTAITYGGSGSWYYVEGRDSLFAKALLTMFTAVNQSFFMGLFFFISGWVTPASFDRKGPVRFMKDRVVRFGIPLLVFMILFDPQLWYVSSGYEGSFPDFVKERVWPQPLVGLVSFDTGPLWFLAALLIFGGGYTLYRVLIGHSKVQVISLTPRLIAGYLLIVGIANFLIRIFMPVGKTVLSLQLAYFPAYIGLFIAGIAAYRGGWLERLSASSARKWGWAAAGLIVLIPIVLALGGALEGSTAAFEGGATWQSLFYSFIDPVLGLAISYVLLVLFRDRDRNRNGQRTSTKGKVGTWLSAHTFTVYIIHALVVVYVSYFLREVELQPLLKFLLAGSLALPLTFAAAGLIRRIPGADRIL